MKRLLWTLTAAGLLMGLSGCETVSYRTRLIPNGQRIEQHAPFFLYGLIGRQTVDLDNLCPRGVARWYDQSTFLNGFLSSITLGIYTPLTVVVFCSDGDPVPPPPSPLVPSPSESEVAP